MASTGQTQCRWRLEDRSNPRPVERRLSLESIRNISDEILHSTFFLRWSSAAPAVVVFSPNAHRLD
jgi:hypothetical protein